MLKRKHLYKSSWDWGVLLCLCFLLSEGTWAQQLVPPISSFTTSTYDAASQNWDISSDTAGVVYVANNEGLLRYDGQRWELNSLPNRTVVRSVYCQVDRVYTGSYEEFGYWRQDGFGKLAYTSLTPLLKPDTFDNEEFWEIIKFGNGVAFRSFGKVYLYDGAKITAINPDFLITSLCVFQNKLVVGSNSGRLYLLKDTRLIPFSANSTPQGQPIADLAAMGDRLLVATRILGLFEYEDSMIQPWPGTAVNDFLKVNELNKIVALGGGKIALGTIKGGVAILDLDVSQWSHYDRTAGLINNTILGMHAQNGKLWLGLDNGLNSIDLYAAIAYYFDNTGELGAVYDIAVQGEEVFLGSNTGVHRLVNGQRSFVKGSQGQVWSFAKVGSKLVANHNRGLFFVQPGGLVPISTRTGSYTLKPLPNNNNLFMDATYNGLDFYRKAEGKLIPVESNDLHSEPLDDFVFQDERTLWASHPYKGFYKMMLSRDSLGFEGSQRFEDQRLLPAFKTRVHKIKNEIAFNNDGKWFRYNGLIDSIEPFDELGDYKDYSLVSDDERGYWFKAAKAQGFIYTDFARDSLYVIAPILEDHLIKGYENVKRFNDSIFYIPLNDGFATFNLAAYKRKNQLRPIPPPTINGVACGKGNLILTEQDRKIDFKESTTLIFRFSTPTLEVPRFYYELNAEEKGFLDKGQISFQNLSAGEYTFRVWAMVKGVKSEVPMLQHFTILPPWYRSNLMKVAYLLLLLLTIAMIYGYNRRKLNAYRKTLEAKIKKEQERKVEIMERNKLLEEINAKSKELVNTTYQVAQRNKTLLDVKRELNEVKGNFGNQFKFKSIENKINTMVEGNDQWEVFETNFKEINKDFFHDLLEDFPDLSTKDLKLCAYLKMNLSTKEIAPLMSISVRGVEIHRYRLRKKLNLDSKKNLSKYMIKNY